jgi:energy-coupling factor transporter ATP-binding protein EcfA2
MHKAGISLSATEMDMLFTKQNRNPEDQEDLNFSSSSWHAAVPFSSVPIATTEPVVYDSSISSNNKMTPSLLQQFENIKARGARGSDTLASQNDGDEAIVTLSTTPRIDYSSSNSSSNVTAKRNPHFPIATVIPINEQGKVTSSSLNISVGNDTQKVKSSLKGSGPLILNRDPSIQESRLQLPICGMEQEIVEAITANDVIILCGETGSGKSTQVPQFLYENGFSSSGLIGITQPRRVAVTSTASRVATEMGCPFDDTSAAGAGRKQHIGGSTSNLVGFQIRHDASTLNANMKIKFMTDGILLKEISGDILLKKYSVVILDEAHERNVNTDVLLGMLSRAIPLRKRQHAAEVAEWLKLPLSERKCYEPPLQPLRLVIM